MKPGISVDTKGIRDALKKIELYRDDLIFIEGAGSYPLVNGMRRLVPVDTGATKLSIRSHLVEFTDERIVDDIGPDTEYAFYIEYGIEDEPNYPIQPFIRPAVKKAFPTVIRVIGYALAEIIQLQWPK